MSAKQTRSDQKESLELDAKQVRYLAFEEEDPEGLFEFVKNEFFEEWRWGNVNELIIKDLVGNYWRTLWREQSGDNYWNTFEDGGTIEFERVVPKEKVVIDYVLPAYAD